MIDESNVSRRHPRPRPRILKRGRTPDPDPELPYQRHPTRSDPAPCDDNPLPTPRDVLIPDDMFREILTRLPAKSLMRFKCVSRHWRSTIMDPSFALAYRGGFRGLLVYEPFLINRLERKRCFFYLSIDGDTSQVSYHSTLHHHGTRMGLTNVVNGLVCFYDRNYSWLFNIATRERMQLPVSTYEAQASSYHLGFDPVNKLYKLLKICPVYNNYDDNHPGEALDDAVFVRYLNCEILTVGVDSSWRIVDPFPPIEVKFSSVCINGVIYWEERREDDDHDHRLIGFHPVGERFQIIPRPKGTTDYSLFKFGPSLTLSVYYSYFFSTRASIMLLYYRDGSWRRTDEQMLNLDSNTFIPTGILPDGKVLIFEGIRVIEFPQPFYLLDPSKRELKTIVMRLPPGSSFSSVFVDNGINNGILNFPYYYEENIMPLRCLGCRDSG